jgi:hypothetical protein
MDSRSWKPTKIGRSVILLGLLIYGSVAMPRHAAQVFAIDVKANTTQLLGGAIELADLSGLAVHPYTQELHALHVVQRGAKTTSLMRLDTASGAQEWIGALGLEHGEGLGFHPGDASLWSWWRDHGLIRIDPVTADVQLVQAGDLPVSALAWDPNGDVLYLAGNRSLWTYREDSAGFPLIQEPLPVLVGGMAMRADGQLLLTAANTGTAGLDLLVFDPQSGSVMATFGVPALPIDGGRSRGGIAAFVKSLSWPLACGNFSPGGRADLIRSVQIDPPALCSGESAMVRVEASHPEGGGNPVRVSIGGLPGEERSLQFEGMPGPRLVHVSASTDEGYVDGGTWEVEVVDCGPVRMPARLSVGMNPYHPYVVDFLVANAAEIAPDGAQYEWDFGDGLQETTSARFVSHSYEAALPHDREHLYFHASVTLQLPDGTSLQTPTTVSVWNAYAGARRRGLIQPLLTYEQELTSSDNQMIGAYAMRNLEDESIVLSERRAGFRPCDPALEPDLGPWEAISLEIGPGELLEDSLVLDAATVPMQACGVELHLAGPFGPVDRVAADLYFEIKRDPSSFQPVTDPATLEMLADAIERGLVEDPDVISDEELHQLSHAGLIELPPPVGPTAEPARSLKKPAPDCSADPIQIGCPCERGDVTEDPPGNVGDISCQATKEFAVFPAHLPNALKGDVILVGGCGFVGELLDVLDQDYTHTGIMTRNYTEIAHSTSTADRADNHIIERNFPALYIEPSVLRWGWPGIIRSDVGTAFSTLKLNKLKDDLGDEYVLKDFTAEPSRCFGEIVLPLVVKPPPAQAQAVRPLLRTAADEARRLATPVDEWDPNGQWGKGNYRFYAYTDATIVDDPTYDHPSDQPATICSTFVWHVLKSAGADLEGPGFEPKEPASNCWRIDENGDRIPWVGEDGLYCYPKDGRAEAAKTMWDTVYETVMRKSFSDPLFRVAAHGIANQLVNCFAADQCDSEDISHSDWKDPGDGMTVSPGNILLWDPPTDEDSDGVIDYGAYGYSERLVFRSGGYKRVYHWAPSEGTGSVAGVVRYDDEEETPANEATVILEAVGGLETISDANGRFEFLAVPAGTYEIVAQKQEGDLFLSSRDGLVTVKKDKEAEVELVLLPPLEAYRTVNATGIYTLLDWYESWWPFPPICFSEFQLTGDQDISGLTCYVDPINPESPVVEWHEGLGDTDLDIRMKCTLQPDNSVLVEIESNLDDRLHCDNDSRTRCQCAIGDVCDATAGGPCPAGGICVYYTKQQKTLLPDETHTFENVLLTAEAKICGDWYEDFGSHTITITNEVQW